MQKKMADMLTEVFSCIISQDYHFQTTILAIFFLYPSFVINLYRKILSLIDQSWSSCMPPSRKIEGRREVSNHMLYLYSLSALFLISYTVETRIKEPTFLGDSLLKDLIFCLYNIKDWESVSLIKTCTNCISIAVAFSPIIYFTFKVIFVKMLY